MSEQRCENCRFWLKVTFRPKDNAGECRRSMPVMLPSSLDGPDGSPTYGLWPDTRHDDWCGEWQERPHKVGDIIEDLSPPEFNR